ncbi:hypothetical protein QQ045_010327 [Rhodiola kirilowii]
MANPSCISRVPRGNLSFLFRPEEVTEASNHRIHTLQRRSILLPARQQATKDGNPMVAFTASEIQPGIQRLQHSLIAKFSSGRPSIDDVRHHLSKTWGLEDKSTIGDMDARHILIILPTANESNKIRAHPLRKVCQSLFRLFRWSPDFHQHMSRHAWHAPKLLWDKKGP